MPLDFYHTFGTLLLMSTVLIAVEHRQHAYVVDIYATIDEALTAWTAADDARIRTGTSMADLFYAVRDDADRHDPTVALLHRSGPGAIPAAPAKPKRHQTRIVEGVTLVHQENGMWVAEDGEFEIGYGTGYLTECDEPHPVRFGREDHAWFARLSDWDKRHLPMNEDRRAALFAGRRGYYCRGLEEHVYGMWEVWRRSGDTVVARDESFGDALKSLAEHIRTGRTWE